MQWSNVTEMVFDLFLDEQSVGKEVYYNLMSDRFDSIGLACNCHTEFGYFCVIELGRGIQPKKSVRVNSFDYVNMNQLNRTYPQLIDLHGNNIFITPEFSTLFEGNACALNTYEN